MFDEKSLWKIELGGVKLKCENEKKIQKKSYVSFQNNKKYIFYLSNTVKSNMKKFLGFYSFFVYIIFSNTINILLLSGS